MGNKSWHNTYQTKETHQSWLQTWNSRQIQKKLVELTPSPQNSSKWAMIFLPPKSWFQELSSSRKTTFTPDSLLHQRRTSLQRSFNTRRSVSGGLGLAKWSKRREQGYVQDWKHSWFTFCGVPANAWKLIHNLACKVQSLQDKEVTGYHRLPLTKHVFFDFKEHQAYHKNQNKPRLGLSNTWLTRINQNRVCYGWLASFKAWKQWSYKW